MQFHPTALKHDGAPCFLISEALRGEGALLIDPCGNSPVKGLKGGDLAPRDQVSRALVRTMKAQNLNSVGLDLTKMDPELAEARFPTILERCRDLGLDPVNELIPVAPAAHYWMGGIATNLSALTTLPGLYAVGEVACTGLHGANRLASNSLMECLVFARQMSTIRLNDYDQNYKSIQINHQPCSIRLENNETPESLISAIQDLRTLCWQAAGVDRSPKLMKEALSYINQNSKCINSQPLLQLIYNQKQDICNVMDPISRKELNLLLDLSNRQLTSFLMLKACIFRNESRGGHHRVDAPSELPYWRCHSRQVKGLAISTRPVIN